MKTKVLIIVGPTAVGKSDLAVTLAKQCDGEVISADSRQVYTGLDIGTGKITEKEKRGIPHHILDVANPKDKFSVVKYVELAEKAIADIHARGKLPIICGGTGFYIQALIDGTILPDVPPNDKLRLELSNKSADELLKILQGLDPERAEKIDKKNIRRIIRAIEIATVLGKVPTLTNIEPRYETFWIGLNMGSTKLKGRIRERLEKRLKEGMIDEVKRLHTEGLSWERMDELGLEYRYIALYLQNKITLEEMEDQLRNEIWHYAKRQMTWFKKDNRIQWIDAGDRGIEPLLNVLETFVLPLN